LLFDKIFKAVSDIDIPILKLDAGLEKTFIEINHPVPGIKFHKIIEQISQLPIVYIQTALIKGNPNNTSAKELESYFEIINKVKPIQVHLYSIERNFPHKDIFVVPGVELEQIAALGSQKTGIDIRSFYRR
jgi:wyosine [tRNA(Phe)-imidazoG37] synthetase (radical SAM superfamily)